MSSIAEAFVTVRPDTRQFRALLQAEVTAAVAAVKAPPVIVPVTLAAPNAAALTTQLQAVNSSAAAAATGISTVGTAGTKAAKGVQEATAGTNALRGALIGVSRVTPVTVFGLGAVGFASLLGATAVFKSAEAFATLQDELNVFQATTQATAEEMRAVSDAAIALGGDITLPSTSAVDAATALTTLAKAGLSVQDSLEGARGVLELSAAANISAGSAATLVATQLNAFGLAGEEAITVADLLAAASIAAQGEIEDFGAAFQQAAAVANQSGLSIQQTTVLLTELAKAGLQGSDAGTSLRTTLLRLVPTTKEARQYTEALGIELNDNLTIGEQLPNVIEQYRTQLELLNPAQRTLTLNQIFGQDAIRAATILFGEQGKAYDDLIVSLTKGGEAQELAAAKSKGLGGAFRNLQSQLETIAATFGQVLAPVITEYGNGLADVVSSTNELLQATIGLAENLPALPPLLNDIVVELGKLAVLGPVLGPIKGLSDAFGALSVGNTDFGKITKAIELRKDALEKLQELTRPITPEGIKEIQAQAQAQAARQDFEALIDPINVIVPDRAKIDADAAKVKEAARIANQKITQARIEALRSGQAESKGKIVIPRNLELADLNAQLTASLNDDLAASKAIEAYLQKRLEIAKRVGGTQTDRYKNILKALVTARSATQSVLDEIKTTSEQATKDQEQAFDLALSNQEERLRLAAEKAGNVGPQENALIAFLRAQAKSAKNTTQEQLRFQRALVSELDKQKKAIQQNLDDVAALQQSNLALALKRAQVLTPDDTTDDEQAIRAQIANARKRLAILNRVKDQTIEQKKKVNEIKDEILDYQAALNDLKGSGGASFNDFVKSALENFRQFGGGTTGILTGQAVRGDLAGRLLGFVRPVAVAAVAARSGLPVSTATGEQSNGATVAASRVESAVNRNNTIQARQNAAILVENRKQTEYLRVIALRTRPVGKALADANEALLARGGT